jgi:acyl carrier protein
MRTRDEIAGHIRAIVDEITPGGRDVSAIDGSARLIEDLGLDSLDYATVLLGCEEWLSLRVVEDRVDWQLIGTVDGLATFLLEQQLGPDGAPR